MRPFSYLAVPMQRFIVKGLVLSLLFSLLIKFPATAQLCTGSLGEPIVNITFGAGSNPGLPLSAASTNYSFVSNDCPNDGFYTVRSNTGISASCFGSSWHAVSSDHTGNAGGYFMLVNASVTPGAFYVDTVKGLCAGATFEFAAWIMNVMRSSACSGNGIKPNLTFSIERTDGTLIQQYISGDIPETPAPTWNQYGFFFTTPPGVSNVVLRIVNSAPGGCGNDLALDDITFRPCGPSLNAFINGSGAANAIVCKGDAAAFMLNSTVSSGYTNPAYQWQLNVNGNGFTDIPGATGALLPVSFLSSSPAGTYAYRIAAAEAGNLGLPGCRVYSTPVTLTVEEKPVFTISSNTPVCEYGSLLFNAAPVVTAQYQWNGPNGFAAAGAAVTISPAALSNSGKYYALATTPGGCTHADSVTVAVNPNPVAAVNSTSVTICEEDSVLLTASGGAFYQWKPVSGLSDPSSPTVWAFPDTTRQYEVMVTNSFNCIDTATVLVTVLQNPEADAGPDQFTVQGSPVQLQGTAAGDNISLTWLPPAYLDNPLIETPLANPPAGEYIFRMSVTSADGCGTATDDMRLIVYNKLYIPNAFTPDNNGKNDRWVIPALRVYPGAAVFLYNRNGQLIYTGNSSSAGWDGNFKGLPQPAGVYVYLIRLNDPGATLLTGTVALIR